MEPYSNNIAEYNALLIGLQLAQQMGVQYLEAYGDFKLIISQVKGEYEVHYEDLILYHHAAIQLVNILKASTSVMYHPPKYKGRCSSSTSSYTAFTC